MFKSLLPVAVAAVAVLSLGSPVQAGCVISQDGKSINIITNNSTNSAKNCMVKCQVDTIRGATNISCGGNVPPLAKAHSLCDFDKPEPWYKKVLSSEDTCK